MPTLISPIALNGVIAAANINPSIFTQLWLVKQRIFTEADFDSCISQAFSPFGVQIQTPTLEFLVIPERIQVNLPLENGDHSDLLKNTLGKVAKQLPHTPYKAIGFNMEWRIGKKESEAFGVLNRKLFINEANPLNKYFLEPDCRFGSYVSKNFGNGRLQLRITPLTVTDKKESSTYQSLGLAFNFNFNLQEENKVEQILACLDSWDDSYSFAQKIAAELATQLR